MGVKRLIISSKNSHIKMIRINKKEDVIKLVLKKY